ncbi:MAG: hypothetical protein ACREEB_16860 [Caulobacteraceae bacterium]
MNRQQFEKLARGVAAGQTVKDAALAAGYGPTSTSCYQVVKRADFKTRVEMLKLELQWGGSPDLAPAINMLMGGAHKVFGAEKPSAAALNAATKMVVEAAKLKRVLPRPEEDEPDYDLSTEDWVATYSPRGADSG